MAGPCSVVYKGKEIPYDEFLAMLHDGLLEDLVKNEKINPEKFTDKSWELNKLTKNEDLVTPEQRDAIQSGSIEPISNESIESLESQEASAGEVEEVEKVIADTDAIIGGSIKEPGAEQQGEAGAKPPGAKPPVGPPKAEPIPAEVPKEIVGITKSDLEQARIDNGLKETTKLFKGGPHEEKWNQLKKEISSGELIPEDRIAQVLQTGDFNQRDGMIGQHQFTVLKNEKSDINQQIKELQDIGTDEAKQKIDSLEAQREIIQSKMDETLKFLQYVGSGLGSGLSTFAARIDTSLEFVEMKTSQEAAQGKPLTPAQEKLFKDISDENDRLQAKIKDLEKKHAEADAAERKQTEEKKVEQFKDDVKKANKARKYALTPEKDARQKELAKKFRGEFRDVTKVATLLADKEFREYAKLTAEKFAGDFKMFAKEMIDSLGQKIRPHIGDIWADIKGDEYAVKRTEEEVAGDFNSMVEKTIEDSEGILHEGLFYHLQKLARNRVEAGMTDINEITDSIYEALSDGIPDLDRQELKDAITEYGKFKKLSKDEVTRALAEAKNIGRLQSKYEATERGELPLRNGMERAKKSQEARDLERQILKNINEKDLRQPLTTEQVAAQYKTAEDANHTRLQNAIDDIESELATGVRKEKGTTRKFTDDETKRLQGQLADLKKIRDERFKTDIAEDCVKAKVKAIEKTVDDLNRQIVKLTSGETPEGPITIKTKEGKRVFGFGKEKPTAVEDARVTDLNNRKAALQAELSDLMPETIKNKALIEREMKRLEGRKAFFEDKLERGKSDPSVFASKAKPEKVALDNEGKQLIKDIAHLKYKVAAEKAKAEDAQKGRIQKAGEFANRVLRFNLFTNPAGMGKLTLAAMYRPLMKGPNELVKLALSNTPVVKRIFEKAPTMYTPTIREAGKTLSDYYVKIAAKETFKAAWSEFKDVSDWDLRNEHPEYVKPAGFLGKPEKMHGFLKAFPKDAEFYSSYEKALRNLANTIDPKTGKYYDITDVDVLDMAKDAAIIDAKTTVFMNESELAKGTADFIRKMYASDSVVKQSVGLLLQQMMPIVKVPANFYSNVFEHIPIAGSLKAIGIVASHGIKNLSPEQASAASKVLVNQVMGAMIIGAGAALYNAYGDDLLKKLKANEYWLHNPAYPLIISAMEAQKHLSENYTSSYKKDSEGDVVLNTKKSNTSVHTQGSDYVLKDKEGRVVSSMHKDALEKFKNKVDYDKRVHEKLIAIANGDRQGGVSTYGEALSNMGREELTKLPQMRTAKDINEIVKSDKSLSKKASGMLINILVPKLGSSIAQMMDSENKRDPQTFKEMMQMQIPGQRKNVPLKSNWTMDSWQKEHHEELSPEEIKEKNAKAKKANSKLE